MTIIDAERATGVSGHTLRFWLKKGVLPSVQRGPHGVAQFSDTDIEWVRWVEFLRSVGMGLAEVRRYVELASEGLASAPQRREMMAQTLSKVQSEQERLAAAAQTLTAKIAKYDAQIAENTDAFNPHSKDYICRKKCGE